MDKDLIEDKLSQIINQSNEKKYSILLNKLDPFYGRTDKSVSAVW